MFDQDTANNFMGRFTSFYVPRILKYCEKKQSDLLKLTSSIQDGMYYIFKNHSVLLDIYPAFISLLNSKFLKILFR